MVAPAWLKYRGDNKGEKDHAIEKAFLTVKWT